MKNLLVAQSGGPTSAINATLAGVVKNALSSPSVDKITDRSTESREC